jgi:hypothetical protein
MTLDGTDDASVVTRRDESWVLTSDQVVALTVRLMWCRADRTGTAVRADSRGGTHTTHRYYLIE